MPSKRSLSASVVFAAFLGIVLLGANVFFVAGAAHANGLPAHQTLPDDVASMNHLLNNAFFIELAAEACGTRAAAPDLKYLCDSIHANQVAQIRNVQGTLYLLTGQRPWNPVLTKKDQGIIENLLFGSFANAGEFGVAAIDAMITKYNDSDAESSLCANRGFKYQTEHFCRTLNAVDAAQANAVEDYKTFHFSDIPSNVAPVHKLHP
ncbi:MAG: hypothetical protein H0X24_02975 [Ktedonobacterales bacterium]|nr:hypothetical protein [Ktedonobacterales bacterium]